MVNTKCNEVSFILKFTTYCVVVYKNMTFVQTRHEYIHSILFGDY